MNKQEYQKVLIVDIKERGYRWDTVKAKGGREIPLTDASINQLKAIKNKLKKQNQDKLLRNVRKTLDKQLEFDFMAESADAV